MSEGGGPVSADFEKAFAEVLNGSARAAVLKKYNLTEADFVNLSEGQKNTLKLEIQAGANEVTKSSLYGKNGMRLVDGKWVRQD
ncbi:hypothetical protein A8145_21410 [Mesorhizobium loti]|uniref:Uncharacterized protein n=2 Tax=Rhizobium loti TaxID=381 RepID=A0AA91F4L9_RHILI|nr:hypothetical protein A8145_21410 [Mesorhizobium loti]